jgi:hypothetical protein
MPDAASPSRQSSGAPICTCGAGPDQAIDYHAADCPFPQGVCDFCDAPTDGVLNEDTPCCETCANKIQEGQSHAV